jgi:hypothetical protein
MMEATRKEVLEVLAELSELTPKVRFGQLIANLWYLARGLSNEASWDMDDEDLLKAAHAHLEKWRLSRGAPV